MSGPDRGTEAPQTMQAVGLARRPGGGSAWQRFRTTREGKVFILVTCGVGLAAINTGNNLLFLIFGFMLSLIVLSGILSEIVLRGVRVERRLPRRAFANTTALVELALTNQKTRAPSYSLEVEDLAEGLPTERRCYFLKVAAGAQQVASYRRVPRKRGYLRLTGFRIATRYPFGIIEKWRIVRAPDELLVYPELAADDFVESDLQNIGTESPTPRVGPGSEVVGLRAHREGEEARAIHWRRSAALGRLVAYEKQRDASSHLTIVLDNARPLEADVQAWDDGFEHALSRAAAIAVAAVGRDLSVDIACRGERSALVNAGNPIDPLLRFLALLQPVVAPDPPPLQVPSRAARVIEVSVQPRVRSAA